MSPKQGAPSHILRLHYFTKRVRYLCALPPSAFQPFYETPQLPYKRCARAVDTVWFNCGRVTVPIMFKEICRGEVALHCTPDDAWMIIRNDVLNITSFLEEHPGGMEILIEFVCTRQL
uniref:Cytochrome b5 heme-binding domain-containing protein n=1 Tax=Heterorhabditis bacteriophora TaxID=37862 RepID=A0A1I7W9R1_HETBA